MTALCISTSAGIPTTIHCHARMNHCPCWERYILQYPCASESHLPLAWLQLSLKPLADSGDIRRSSTKRSDRCPQMQAFNITLGIFSGPITPCLHSRVRACTGPQHNSNQVPLFLLLAIRDTAVYFQEESIRYFAALRALFTSYGWNIL